ncbi:MAG: F-type H+-transporting ATPase subunit a [Candidatus Peregrinibacteria bacterium Gr01-1014_25]|nr:MAG: F-type H+-transporting ATPase subunit a [Candidatus Peregrinibacteria bacterium Gr01-1014_25]
MEFIIPPLASETIFHIGSFEVRNTLIMAWLACGVLILLALAARSTGYKLIPGRGQALVETVVEGLYNFFDSIIQNPKRTRLLFPLVATFFFFIILSNWMGILPGVGSITVEGMHEGHPEQLPIFRSMNADVNVTLAFSIVSVIVTQAVGIASVGILPYVRKYAVAPWHPPYLIGTFVGILEFIGEFIRLLSFAFRLFGNIFAGEVLLMVVSQLAPFLIPIPFFGLEVFVGFIQALVFAMLTVVFIQMASIPHGEHAH